MSEEDAKPPPIFHSAVEALVKELVYSNFEQLERDGRIGRLTIEELRSAIREYGRTLIPLPPEWWHHSVIFLLEGYSDRWLIDIDLWTAEEGLSDLTLQVEAWQTSDGIRLSIDDLHVL